MIDMLLQPFQFEFMRNAFLMCLIIAMPTAFLSCFLVLKGWALMGDAISHAVLPGIVLAYILQLPILLGAFVGGMGCALATGFITTRSRVKEDTVMGVVFSGMFAAGIVMYVAFDTSVHLDHILFGNILGVSIYDLWVTALICMIVAVLLIIFARDLMLYCFDSVQARASGLWVFGLHYGLLACIALIVVATLNATGLILAIGLLISPGAIAFLITQRFKQMVLVAIATNCVGMSVGTWISFHIDSAPAPTIILVLTFLFVCAFFWKQIRSDRVLAKFQ